MRFFLLLLTLPALFACGEGAADGDVIVDGPAAEAPWVNGWNTVKRMDLGMSGAAQEIGERMTRSMRENPTWMAEYMAEHENLPAGVPLPYHENFGITEAEYGQFLRASARREGQLVEMGETQFKAITKNGVTTFEAGKDLRTLSAIEIDWVNDRVTTPWGRVEGSSPQSVPEGEVIGPLEGRIWMKSEGDGMAALTGGGNVFSLRLLVGKRNGGADGYLYLRMIAVEEGEPQVNDSITLQWPLED